MTNNFTPAGAVPASRAEKASKPFRPVDVQDLRRSLKVGAGDEKGAGNDVMRSLFDDYIESCVEGLRSVPFPGTVSKTRKTHARFAHSQETGSPFLSART